jgi:beta-galactosidase
MRAFFAALVCVSILFLAASCSRKAPEFVRNDLIYAPAEAAKPFINFDGGGFVVQGKRTYLSSGSMHYSRIPHELWADRLMRVRRANFAAVESYVFWNFHEPRENEFDFAGDKDFGAFLETAQRTGLYAIARVGPYVCANWDSGGFPVWLRFKPDMLLRTDDPSYLQWNDHWYEKILPLVARHQINHGGNVVFVQLENEHPQAWGVATNIPYFVHLDKEAVKLGLEVPHVMSGLHHRGNPAPSSLDPSKRANPWFSTEFWSGFSDDYLPLSDARSRALENANWLILAHGAGGHNFYMLVGGTTFESWNDDITTANYVCAAAIGQAGELRPIYYRMKRINQLAQSFPEILANGTDAMSSVSNLVAGAGVEIIGARQSAAGTIVFVQNTTSNETTAKFKSGETLQLAGFGTYPLPRDVVLAGDFKIVDSTLPVLALVHHDQMETLIVYGQPGETGRLTLAAKGKVELGAKSPAFTSDSTNDGQVDLKIKIPETSVAECILNQSAHSLRILVINRNLSLYTWIVGPADEQYVIFGPSFVQAVKETGSEMSVVIERPYGQPSSGQVAIYGGHDKSWHLRVDADRSIEALPAPTLSDWQMSPATQASPAFDDSKWMHSKSPQQMGADGDISAFAWYRAAVRVPSAGSGTLHLQGGDNLKVFVNGQHCVESNGIVNADFVSGNNTVAVFASHHGRNQLQNYLDTLENHDNKGLWGSPSLEVGGQTIKIIGWTMRGGPGADPTTIVNWTTSADTKGVPTFYRTTFSAQPSGELGAYPILRVRLKGLSRGMMWINGHSLGRYPEKTKLNTMYIPECWLKDGENALIVLDETGVNPGQVRLEVDKDASREVIRASEPVDPSTPITVPQENPQHHSAL